MWLMLLWLSARTCAAPEVLEHHRAAVEHFGYFDFHAAAEEFWEAWKADPDCEPAIINFVIACLHSGRLHEAEVQLQRLLRRHPDEPRITYLQGVLLQRQGKENEARNFFTAVLERDPTDSATLGQLALIAFHQGRFEEALEYVERARREDPSSPMLIYSEARIRLQLGQREAAHRLFEEFRNRKNSEPRPMTGGMGEPTVIPGKYAQLICIDPQQVGENHIDGKSAGQFVTQSP